MLHSILKRTKVVSFVLLALCVFGLNAAHAEVSILFTATTCSYTSNLGADSELGIEEPGSFGAKVNKCRASIPSVNTGFGTATVDIGPLSPILAVGFLQAAISANPEIGEVTSAEARLTVSLNNPGIIKLKQKVDVGNTRTFLDGKEVFPSKLGNSFDVLQGQHIVVVESQSAFKPDSFFNANTIVDIDVEETGAAPELPPPPPLPTTAPPPQPIPTLFSKVVVIADAVKNLRFPAKLSQTKSFKNKKTQINGQLTDVISTLGAEIGILKVDGSRSIQELTDTARKRIAALLRSKNSDTFKLAKKKALAALADISNAES